MTIKIKALPADDGDCLLITYEDSDKIYNILVDGGRATKRTLRILNDEINYIKSLNQCIDLLVVTHIDCDHINGILSIFEKDTNKELVRKVWFNSGENIANFLRKDVSVEREVPIVRINDTQIGVNQGQSLEKELKKLHLIETEIIMQGDQIRIGNAEIHILSPNLHNIKKLDEKWEVELEEKKDLKISSTSTNNDYNFSVCELVNEEFREDKSVANSSSIAFLMKYKDKNIMMTGDAHPTVIREGLKELGYSKNKKLSIDIMKVSHHGSKGNTSDELMELISCNRYIISTNGGPKNKPKPDKEALSRILSSNRAETILFYFNYPIFESIFTAKEVTEFKIHCEDLSALDTKYMIEV